MIDTKDWLRKYYADVDVDDEFLIKQAELVDAFLLDYLADIELGDM